jgi:hypothetical protein
MANDGQQQQRCEWCGGQRHRAELWCGGRISRDSRGRNVFYIRRRVKGKQKEVSTGAETWASAWQHLQRFQADPEAYLREHFAAPPVERQALYLSQELAQRYEEWRPPSRVARPMSRDWLRKRAHELLFWQETLKGKDLRTVTLEDVAPHCPRDTVHRHRRSVIKGLLVWLRNPEAHPGGAALLRSGEGPNLSPLSSIQSTPEQWLRPKAVPPKDWLLVRKALGAHVVHSGPQRKKVTRPWVHFGQALDVLGATGWHVSELTRFIAAGRVDPKPKGAEPGTAGVLVCPEAKGGGQLFVRVGAVARTSAQALLGRKAFSAARFSRSVAAACKKAINGKRDVTVFHPGQARHSVATWAIDKGASREQVALFLNHKSLATTMKFYATMSVPPKVPTLL